MCWGITCGDGWFNILIGLCELINNRVNYINKQIDIDFQKRRSSLVPVTRNYLVCEVVQVKEKFGGLRFYIEGGDDYILGLIALAESMSYVVCSSCGNKGMPKKTGWLKTLCDQCYNQQIQKIDHHNQK